MAIQESAFDRPLEEDYRTTLRDLGLELSSTQAERVVLFASQLQHMTNDKKSPLAAAPHGFHPTKTLNRAMRERFDSLRDEGLSGQDIRVLLGQEPAEQPVPVSRAIVVYRRPAA